MSTDITPTTLPLVDDAVRKRRATDTAPNGNGLQKIKTETSLPARRNTNSQPPQSVWKRLFTPDKKVGATPTIWKSMRTVVMASWLNILLVFIPVSWILNFTEKEKSPVLVFVFSFLAIIPLAKLLGLATEELALRVGQTIGGLLNATLGNAVELIVAIIALTQCKLYVVQSSLIGSILSNILLVLGMCFFAGGTKFSEQGFLASAANVNSSLLTISVTAVIIPSAFIAAINFSPGNAPSKQSTQMQGSEVLKMSRGVAIILLFIYGSYLVFQLWSHAHLYNAGSGDDFQSTAYPKRASPTDPQADDPEAGTVVAKEDEEVEEPQMSVAACIVLLVTVTVLVAVTAEWLVDSIEGVTESSALTQQWVGLILLPIVGNAAEHVTAVTVSVKDKLTLSLGVAVGSSIQIALFVIPFITVLGWILNKPLSLLFDPFQSIVLFLSVITVNYCVQDGKSNWLEGMVLMCLYVIIAVSVWFYPGVDAASSIGLSCPTPT